MKYASDIINLMNAYPGRDFRVLELVRHVTRGRMLSVRERDAARKAVNRVLEVLVANGAAVVAVPALKQGEHSLYSVSHKWDMTLEKVGLEVGQ